MGNNTININWSKELQERIPIVKERKLVNVNSIADGPFNGLALITECLIGKFKGSGKKKKMNSQDRSDCNILASIKSQTMVVSIPEQDIVISLRITDVVDLLMAANAKHKILDAVEKENQVKEAPTL